MHMNEHNNKTSLSYLPELRLTDFSTSHGQPKKYIKSACSKELFQYSITACLCILQFVCTETFYI